MKLERRGTTGKIRSGGFCATMEDPLFTLARGLTAAGASRLHVLATDASSEALDDLLLLLKEPQCDVNKT